MEIILSLSIVFLMGTLTAYMDLSSFFRRKRISIVTIFRHWVGLLFLIANGTIGSLFLIWAFTDKNAVINKMIPSSNPIIVALIIGVSVPVIIRSKWFTIGPSERSAVGLAAIYEWIRINVLHRVHQHSIHLKDKLIKKYSMLVESNAEIANEIHRKVIDEVRPFISSDSELEELDAEFNNIQGDFEDREGTQRHLSEIFKWAIERTSISYFKSCMENLTSQR